MKPLGPQHGAQYWWQLPLQVQRPAQVSTYLGSRDVADALSVHSAGYSSSDVEKNKLSLVPESPDGQEKKVVAHPTL